MKKIAIQPFEPLHQPDVIALILDIQIREFQVPITLKDQPDLLMIPDFYQQKNGQFWVALMDEEVVGTIALIDGGDGIGALRKMFVKQAFRGKELGIGQLLLDTLLTHARVCGFTCLYLGTNERLKAAIRFYEKNGWELVDKKQLPPQYPVMGVDTLFYKFETQVVLR